MPEILIQHKNIPASGRHAPHSYEYPTETERLAATGFTVADLHKYAVQLNDGSVWRLKAVDPIQWARVGGVGDWNELPGKPTEFPPAAHTHTPDEVGTAAVVTQAIADLKAEADPFPQYTTQQEVLDIAQVKSVAGKTGIVDLEIVDVEGLETALNNKAPLSHAQDINNPHQVTKQQVGLGNEENIAPADMPVSTATQTALDGKSNIGHTHTALEVAGAVRSINGKYPNANGAVTIDTGGAGGGEEFQRFKKRNYFGIKLLES